MQRTFVRSLAKAAKAAAKGPVVDSSKVNPAKFADVTKAAQAGVSAETASLSKGAAMPNGEVENLRRFIVPVQGGATQSHVLKKDAVRKWATSWAGNVKARVNKASDKKVALPKETFERMKREIAAESQRLNVQKVTISNKVSLKQLGL